MVRRSPRLNGRAGPTKGPTTNKSKKRKTSRKRQTKPKDSGLNYSDNHVTKTDTVGLRLYEVQTDISQNIVYVKIQDLFGSDNLFVVGDGVTAVNIGRQVTDEEKQKLKEMAKSMGCIDTEIKNYLP